MAKKWFGPVLCPAGCCYEPPPPPPPPPCACEDSDCLELYANNYTSFSLEVDIDDAYNCFARYKELRCEPTCKNVYQVDEIEVDVDGLSGFNGTYDIPFYAFDDYLNEWVVADPSAVSCGVWFWPTLTATVNVTQVRRRYSQPQDIYSLYTDSGCIESTQTLTQSITLYMETRSGLVWTNDLPTSGLFSSLTFPPVSNAIGVQQSPAVVQQVETGTPFACSSGANPAISNTLNVNTTNPSRFSPAANGPDFAFISNFEAISGGFINAGALGNPYAQNQPLGVRYENDYQLEPRTSSGYDWSVYPYGGPGIPVSSTQCTLDLEEYEQQINAVSTYIDDLFGTNPLVQCNPFYPFVSPKYIAGTYRPQIWEFTNTAWRQYLKCTINV